MNKVIEKIVTWYLEKLKPWFLTVAMYLGVLLIYFVIATFLSAYTSLDRNTMFAILFFASFAIDIWVGEYVEPQNRLKRIIHGVKLDRRKTETQLKNKLEDIKKRAQS